MTLLFVFQCLALFLLSGLHFYWAFGGTMVFSNTLPTTAKGESVLDPKWFHSGAVGLILAFFGAYYLSFLFTPNSVPAWIYRWGGWFIGTIFMLRAIGDFNYAGFSKTVKTTSFGKRDTKFYSLLCFILGITALALAWHY